MTSVLDSYTEELTDLLKEIEQKRGMRTASPHAGETHVACTANAVRLSTNELSPLLSLTERMSRLTLWCVCAVGQNRSKRMRWTH